MVVVFRSSLAVSWFFRLDLARTIPTLLIPALTWGIPYLFIECVNRSILCYSIRQHGCHLYKMRMEFVCPRYKIVITVGCKYIKLIFTCCYHLFIFVTILMYISRILHEFHYNRTKLTASRLWQHFITGKLFIFC